MDQFKYVPPCDFVEGGTIPPLHARTMDYLHTIFKTRELDEFYLGGLPAERMVQQLARIKLKRRTDDWQIICRDLDVHSEHATVFIQGLLGHY